MYSENNMKEQLKPYFTQDIRGNYLISKGVPIIDYYSHMGGKVTNK